MSVFMGLRCPYCTRALAAILCPPLLLQSVPLRHIWALSNGVRAWPGLYFPLSLGYLRKGHQNGSTCRVYILETWFIITLGSTESRGGKAEEENQSNRLKDDS